MTLPPAPETFAAVVDALGAHQSECLFVDDTIENVLAAERAGLKAHRYLGPGGLEGFIASCTGS